MTNSRFRCVALPCALVVVSLAACGCASMSGTSSKWATAWKKSTEPKPADPNHEEIVTYWGQKKKQTKLEEMPAELKERLTKKSDQSQRSRDYADNFKVGNQRLKEGRLEEARRAYELALAARPDDPDVHHRLAVVADKQQMFGAADDHYEVALRRRPRDPNLLSDIGYSHFLRGDDLRAETTFREALTIDPSHQGALLNLGTLFGKQGRYDDAFALFKRSTTQAETQQYMAQLFPQGRPSEVAQAAAGQRAVQPGSADERTDVRNMTFEQRKLEMERRQLEGNQSRQQQFAQAPSQRDGAGDAVSPDPRWMQDQRPSITPNSQPWVTNQNVGDQSANSTQTGNPGLGQVSPNSPSSQTGTAMQPGARPVSPMSNSGLSPNGTVQQQEFAAAPSQGSLVAPPGTSPHANIDFWPGASVQANARPVNPALAQSQSQSPIEQMGYTRESPAGGVSASQAAAQLGMSAGPGSLFPVMPSNSAPTGGMSRPPSAPLANEQRFRNESPLPSQYQNSVNQYAPNRSPNGGAIQQLGGDGSAFNQFSPNWPGASSARPNGTAQQSPAAHDVTIAPSSPAGNMSGPWDTTSVWQQPTSNVGSGVVQAGGSSGWNQSPSSATDPLSSFPSEKGTSGFSRYAKTPWDDPTSQPVGSRPYNGAWPNNNSMPAGASSGSGTAPNSLPMNSLPMWNGGSGAGASMQNGTGSASGGSSNSAPQQWPYSPTR